MRLPYPVIGKGQGILCKSMEELIGAAPGFHKREVRVIVKF